MREAGTTLLLVTTPQAPVYSLALPSFCFLLLVCEVLGPGVVPVCVVCG